MAENIKVATAGVNPRIIDTRTLSIAFINMIINGMLKMIPINTKPEPAGIFLPFFPAWLQLQLGQ
jgi:hypothetical protein